MKNNFTWLIALLMSVGLMAQDYSVSLIPSDLLENSNLVVRSDHKEVVIKRHNDLRVTRKKVVTVFNEEGFNKLHQAFHYYGQIKLDYLTGKIYDANAKVIKKLKGNDFEHRIEFHNKKSEVKSAGYYIDFDFDKVEYPFTLEVSYSYQSRTTAFIPSWVPLDTHNQSVEKSAMRVINYSRPRLNHLKRNLFDYPSVEVQEGFQSFQVEAKNLNAVPKEDYQPALLNFTPQVHFTLDHFNLGAMDGRATSWQHLGTWKYLNTPINTWAVENASIDFIAGLLQNIQAEDFTLEKKVEIIYNFVKENHHLINRTVENIDWQKNEKVGPTHLEYDACLNTLFYTKNLLQLYGIKAFYALVIVNEQPVDLIEELPSIQGNQMMLYVPLINDEIWLDCASYEWPFNFVSRSKAQRRVIIITEQGGELRFTPSYTPEENLQSTSIQLEIAEDGKIINAELQRHTKKIAFERRRLLHQEKQLEEDYIKQFSEITNLAIQNLNVKVSPNEAKIEEELNFTGKLSTKTNGGAVFSLSSFGTPFQLPNQLSSRSSPFSIAKGFKYKDEIELKLPPQASLNLPYTKIETDSKFGTYQVQVSQTENTIRINRLFILKSGEFLKADYTSFYAFMKKINDYELQEFHVLN